MSVVSVIAGVAVPAAVSALVNAAQAALGGGGGESRSARALSSGLSVNELVEMQQGATVGGGFPTFPTGSAIEIVPSTRFDLLPDGTIRLVKRRKRRKRLLTCSDRADIAFLTGTLGKGAMGQSAVTSLLSRCN